MSERVSALNNAITQLSTFAGETSLQGAAYDNAKNFGTAVLTPMLQGMILFSEGVSEKVTELQTLYASICGGEDLDSDILTQKITADTSALRNAEKLLDALNQDEGSSKSAKATQSTNIKTLKKRIKSNEKKLENLLKFDAQSAKVFNDLQKMESTVSQGITAVSSSYSSYNSQTGQFGGLDKDQLNWTKTVKKGWKKREEKIEKVKAKELKAQKEKEEEGPTGHVDSDLSDLNAGVDGYLGQAKAGDKNLGSSVKVFSGGASAGFMNPFSSKTSKGKEEKNMH